MIKKIFLWAFLGGTLYGAASELRDVVVVGGDTGAGSSISSGSPVSSLCTSSSVGGAIDAIPYGLRRRRLNLSFLSPDPSAAIDDPEMVAALDTERRYLEERIEREKTQLGSDRRRGTANLARSMGLHGSIKSSDQDEDDDDDESFEDEEVKLTRDELIELVARVRGTHAVVMDQTHQKVLKAKELKEREEEFERRAKRDRCIDITKNIVAIFGTAAGVIGGVLGIISITSC